MGLEVSSGCALMAVSPQGTTVLTVTAMDRDTGVNDKISYSFTSEQGGTEWGGHPGDCIWAPAANSSPHD